MSALSEIYQYHLNTFEHRVTLTDSEHEVIKCPLLKLRLPSWLADIVTWTDEVLHIEYLARGVSNVQSSAREGGHLGSQKCDSVSSLINSLPLWHSLTHTHIDLSI